MTVITIAHIINPFNADKTSDLFRAQPITFASMLKAQEEAGGLANIELLCANFPQDAQMIPRGFKATRALDQSVPDLSEFKHPLKLPLIADILQRAYEESSAEYIIYTNVDIGLYPQFYIKVVEFITGGLDAFIINRRRLKSNYTRVEDLDSIYKDEGLEHPGFDCFVFHRSLFSKMKLTGICIGVPFIEICLSQNLFALANRFRLYEHEILTFHIGLEVFRRRAPREYFWYNRKAYLKNEKVLLPQMSLQNFPYSNSWWPLRFIKWVLHPCIPTRLILKLCLNRISGR